MGKSCNHTIPNKSHIIRTIRVNALPNKSLISFLEFYSSNLRPYYIPIGLFRYIGLASNPSHPITTLHRTEYTPNSRLWHKAILCVLLCSSNFLLLPYDITDSYCTLTLEYLICSTNLIWFISIPVLLTQQIDTQKHDNTSSFEHPKCLPPPPTNSNELFI